MSRYIFKEKNCNFSDIEYYENKDETDKEVNNLDIYEIEEEPSYYIEEFNSYYYNYLTNYSPEYKEKFKNNLDNLKNFDILYIGRVTLIIELLKRLYFDSKNRVEGTAKALLNKKKIFLEKFKNFDDSLKSNYKIEKNSKFDLDTRKFVIYFLFYFAFYKFKQLFSNIGKAKNFFFNLKNKAFFSPQEKFSFSDITPLFEQIDGKSPIEELECVITYASILLLASNSEKNYSEIVNLLKNMPNLPMYLVNPIKIYFKIIQEDNFIQNTNYIIEFVWRFSSVLFQMMNNSYLSKYAFSLFYSAIFPFAFYKKEKIFTNLFENPFSSLITSVMNANTYNNSKGELDNQCKLIFEAIDQFSDLENIVIN